MTDMCFCFSILCIIILLQFLNISVVILCLFSVPAYGVYVLMRPICVFNDWFWLLFRLSSPLSSYSSAQVKWCLLIQTHLVSAVFYSTINVHDV